jgi:hypothetical protein
VNEFTGLLLPFKDLLNMSFTIPCTLAMLKPSRQRAILPTEVPRQASKKAEAHDV